MAKIGVRFPTGRISDVQRFVAVGFACPGMAEDAIATVAACHGSGRNSRTAAIRVARSVAVMAATKKIMQPGAKAAN